MTPIEQWEVAQDDYLEALKGLANMLVEAGASKDENLLDALQRVGGEEAGMQKARERALARMSWKP